MSSHSHRVHQDKTDRNDSGEVPRKHPPQPEAEITSLSLLLARMIWVIGGPMVLFVVLATTFTRDGGWFTGMDAFYAIVVVLILACRWIEQRSGHAKTASGEPSSAQNFRNYCIGMIFGSAGAWAVTKLIVLYVLHH